MRYLNDEHNFCNKCGKKELPMIFDDGMVLCNRCWLAMTRLIEKWYDDKLPRAKNLLAKSS